MLSKPRNPNLVYPELSYKIVGCAFDVHNTIGGGHPEKYYQKALAEAFHNAELEFRQQVYHPIYYEEKIIGKTFFDFLVENKIIIEIKQDDRYARNHIQQVFNYLKVSNLYLAILINFGNEKVGFKRVVNISSSGDQ